MTQIPTKVRPRARRSPIWEMYILCPELQKKRTSGAVRPCMAAQPEGAAGVFVVGPLRVDNHLVFLCPVCDTADVVGVDGATAQCTTTWLHGQELQWDDRDWICFETDPFEGEHVALKRKRFFYYSAVARALGAVGQRVKLPVCVTDKIQTLHGASETGFQAGRDE